ncbi:MAG: hypothetical protein U0694_28310 [Anaerolineae bacterium]
MTLPVTISEQAQELAIAIRRYGDKVEYNPNGWTRWKNASNSSAT